MTRPGQLKARPKGKTRSSDSHSRRLARGVDRKRRPIHTPMRLLPCRPEALELVPYTGPSPADLMAHALAELKRMARSEGLKGYSRLDKTELAHKLHEHKRTQATPTRNRGDR